MRADGEAAGGKSQALYLGTSLGSRFQMGKPYVTRDVMRARHKYATVTVIIRGEQTWKCAVGQGKGPEVTPYYS